MANLYFNGAVDNNWATLGNWWLDAGGSVPAANLPTSVDDVQIVSGATVSSNSGSVPTVDTMINNGGTITDLSINLRVLSNYGTMTNCTITATDLENQSIYNYNTLMGGTINGDLVNENGFIYSILVGGVFIGPIITGTLTNTQYAQVYINAINLDGYVAGNVVCQDNSVVYALNCPFSNLDMYESSSIQGLVAVNGNVTFHDSSSHGGDLFCTGTCCFKDTSAGCYPVFAGYGGIDYFLYHGSFNINGPVVYQGNAKAFRYRGVDPTLAYVLSINNGYYGWPTGPSATFDETALLATMEDSMGGMTTVTYNIKRGINGSNILGIL